MSAFLLAAGGRIDVGGRIGGLDWIVVGGSSVFHSSLAVLALPQPQSRYVIAGKKNPNHFSFGFFEWTYQKVQGFAHFLLSVLWSTRTLLLVFILR
jgi:hypothetical protein